MRLLVFWMAVIFALSAIPDLSFLYPKHWLRTEHQLFVTDIDWSVVLSFNNPFFDIPTLENLTHLNTIIHKIGHVLFFSVLGWLAYRARRSTKQAFWICVAYSFFDELHQALTPGRSARLFDVVLDVLIALLAIGIAHRFFYKKRPVPS